MRCLYQIATLAFVFLSSVIAVAQETVMRPPVPPPQMAYGGPLRVGGARISADLSSTAAATTVQIEVSNSADQAVQETAALAESRLARPTRTQQISIGARALGRLEEAYQYPVTGDRLKMLRLDPRLELAGKPWSERVAAATIQIKLPAGVKRLVYSSLPNGVFATDPSDGRTVVTYNLKNAYLAPITVKWNSDAQLEVKKTATRQQGVLDVEIEVKNVGSNELSAVVISDNFHPGFVESGTPQTEFEMVQGQQNDRRWVWKHSLSSLAPGNTAVFKYQLRLRNAPPGLTFGGTTVSRTDTGELLGASTSLVVPQ